MARIEGVPAGQTTRAAVRKTAMTLFVLAFGFAAIAGLFGALITKAAPVR